MATVSVYQDKLINCSCNYVSGEKYDSSKLITITADDGFMFEGTFYFTGRDKYGDACNNCEFINEGNKLIVYEPFTYEGTNQANFSELSKILLNGLYTAIGEVVETNEFTNIYLTNNAELSELAKVRYDDGASLVDYGQYISNLYKIPFIIPNDYVVSEKTEIVLGNKKTDVLSSLITTDTIIIDMGNINVIEKYNNVYDYINCQYILHLPLFDKIYLDSEYVINQTINIKYVIDLYSGNCTVNIYSSFIDSLIDNRQEIISSSIPFMQGQSNSIIGIISNANKNSITTPFIEVTRNIPYNVNTLFGKETIESGVIGTYEGYIKCDNVVLNTDATNHEKEEIIKLLNEGVFI